MTDEPTLPGPAPGSPGGPGAAADLDEKVLDEAVRRGLITTVQGASALEESRARRVALLEVLRGKNLVSEEAAKDLDEETREDFVPGYRVLSKLGEGGMGVVYKALQKRLDRVVALKVVMPHLAADGSYLKRFEREAKAVAKLNHPNIVAAYDYGESKGRVFLAMEFVEGLNGADWVRKNGRMEEDRALAVARDVAAGLAHAHAAGIIHRDIKPANILLPAPRAGVTTSAGTLSGAKVTDLGLARSAGGASELTAAGAILGTPGYMAPEQVFGQEIDHRADIYALGATLYQMLTGNRPFDASTPVAVIARQQAERLPDPRDLRPELSPGVAALLQGMMARDPESRYATYKTLLADIDAVKKGNAPALPVPPPGHCTLAAPVNAPAGGTVQLPASARPAAPSSVKTVVGASASEVGARPAAARPPAKSKAGLVAGVAVAGIAIAAFAFWPKPEEKPPAKPPEKSPAPLPVKPPEEKPAPQPPEKPPEPPPPEPKPPEKVPDPAPSPPPPPPTPPPAEPEADMQALESVDEADADAALNRLAEQRRKFDALPAAAKGRAANWMPRWREKMERAGRAGEGRIVDLWKKGEYDRAFELAKRLKDQMGEHAPERLGTLHDRLASIGEKGPAERAAFLAARTGKEKNDPLAVLAALEGFEEQYPFSPDIETTAELRGWAEREAPMVAVDTAPVGAELLLGGRSSGKTPWNGRIAVGKVRAEFRLEGHHPLERDLEVKRSDERQRFFYEMEPLPPPDPEPKAVLSPKGRPTTLYRGEGLGDWLVGAKSWGPSDPSKTAKFADGPGTQPGASLRGSSASGLGFASLNLRPLLESAPELKDAPGWLLEWQMVGEMRSTGGVARTELHFAVGANGEALALGIDGQGAYFGVRDMNSKALRRTRSKDGVTAGKAHTFVVENHGDVFILKVDGERLGSVAVPADLVPERTLRLVVEEGTGYFSDFELRRMK